MTKERLCSIGLAGASVLLVCRLAFAVCGDGVPDSGESCDLGGANGSSTSCCTALCEFRIAGSSCRPSAGPCDVGETCTGTSSACPSDGFQPSNFQCRTAAGACDVAETCSGSGPDCPSDAFEPSGTVCRAPAGACDVSEFCDGNGPDCPPDTVVAAGTVCRPTGGDCDVAESCDGTSPTCPADVVQPAGTVCRSGTGTCDPAESCDGSSVACPADAFAPDGSPCNDGSACTSGDSCFRGVCVGTTDVDACLDHFLCYKSRVSVGSTFTTVNAVHLVDDFEDTHVEVTRPRRLCLPANKNAEGVHDAETHLRAYAIHASPGAPRFVAQPNLVVNNQLGFIHVDAIRYDLLLVPTSKSLTGPAPDPPDENSIGVDHYKCYKVHVTPGTPRFPDRTTVSVTDQFNGVAKTLRLKRPRHLCNPVDKNGEGTKNPTVHLMCYLAKGQPKTPRHKGVFLTDQFGTGQADTVAEQEICIPSTVGS